MIYRFKRSPNVNSRFQDSTTYAYHQGDRWDVWCVCVMRGSRNQQCVVRAAGSCETGWRYGGEPIHPAVPSIVWIFSITRHATTKTEKCSAVQSGCLVGKISRHMPVCLFIVVIGEVWCVCAVWEGCCCCCQAIGGRGSVLTPLHPRHVGSVLGDRGEEEEREAKVQSAKAKMISKLGRSAEREGGSFSWIRGSPLGKGR